MKYLLTCLALIFGMLVSAQEICDNGIDDDGDGLTDLNDSDCLCSTTPIQSIIPNASFEEHTECPITWEQLEYCTGWMQATDGTTDYYNCGYTLPAITNYGLNDIPDGNAMIGAIFMNSWKEYLGACLLSPMIAGENYQLTFQVASLPLTDGPYQGDLEYGPTEIVIYGSANCLTGPLPTLDSPNTYSNQWTVIGSAVYTPVSSWGQFTINFTPATTVNAIMIGAPEILPEGYPTNNGGAPYNPYFLFDNLVLNEASLFGSYISELGNFCDDNLSLVANPTVPLSSAATFQWYKNGVAIIGATAQQYAVPSLETNLGIYSVRISDAPQCFISPQHTVYGKISAPGYTAIQPTCIPNSGKITINAVADFYSFDGGVTWLTTPVAENLAPGLYSAMIKYNSGCISSVSKVDLVAPLQLSWPSIHYEQPTCITAGSITFDTVAAQYSFDGGITWTTNPEKTNLTEGSYNLIYKNEAGCVSYIYEFYLQRIAPWQPQIDFEPPMCSDGGSITILTPGTAYSFDNGVSWGTNPVKDNLPEGFYFVKIKDAEGCESYAANIYLFQSSPPAPQYLQSQAGCSGGNITITTPAAEYSFDGGASWTTNPVMNNAPDGYYEIATKNSQGCISYSQWLYLDSYYPTPATPAFEIIQPASCNATTGTITINSQASQYSFDGGTTWVTSNVKSQLSPGTYNIKVKNEYGCISDNTTAVINAPVGAPPTPTLQITDPTCSVSTGTITIDTPAAFYSFDNGNTWITQNAKSNLLPGNYTVLIKNAEGCISPSFLASISADTGAPATPDATVQQPNCHTSTGIIDITTPAAQYSFDDGLTWSLTSTSALLAVGDYKIRIKNAAGCQSPPLLINVTPDVVAPPIVQDQIFCKDVTAPSLTATGVDLLWYSDPLGGIGTTTAPVPQTLLLGDTTYYVTQSINSCESDRAAIVVTIVDVLPAPVVIDEVVYCQDAPTLPLSANGANLQWFEDPNSGTGSAVAPTPSSEKAGTYVYFVSQSAYGCESNRAQIKVIVLPNPDAPLTQEYISYKHYTLTTALEATGTDIRWYNDNMELLTDAPVPSSAKVGITTFYVSQDIDGCESPFVKITVEILPNYVDIKYPLFFTPNGDANNENWNIYTPQFGIKATVYIFDRYGKLVSQVFSPGHGWDGTLNVSPMPDNDYWFEVIYKEYNVDKKFRAHFSLIR